MESKLNIICLESTAFYELLEQVIDRLKTENNATNEEWIDTEQAKALLKISSKTTLQKLRDNGDIRFSQPLKKHVLYYKQSLQCLHKTVLFKKTFAIEPLLFTTIGLYFFKN